MVMSAIPFWQAKPLADLDRDEWESLCDGCGRCCLHKLEDWDTGEIHYTNVACRMLDLGKCTCKDYPNRRRHIPDCVALSAAEVERLRWLPPTCAYRLLVEGQPLPWWHPLISGDPDSVHRAGVSVRGRAVSETRAGPLDHHIVTWVA